MRLSVLLLSLFISLHLSALECSHYHDDTLMCDDDVTYVPDVIVGRNITACKRGLTIDEEIFLALALANRDTTKDPENCSRYHDNTIICDGDVYYPSHDIQVTNPCTIIVDDGSRDETCNVR